MSKEELEQAVSSLAEQEPDLPGPEDAEMGAEPGALAPDHVGGGVPYYILASIIAYANERRPTGGFLRAVFENDLMNAVGRADLESLRALRAIVSYIYNNVRADCYGSPEKVAAWLRGE